MQGYFGAADAVCLQLVQQFGSEVQAGGGGGNGALMLGVNGLVAFVVGCVGCALDIGRQRQAAGLFEDLVYVEAT